MSQIFQRLRKKQNPVSRRYYEGNEIGPALAFRAVLQFGPSPSKSVACSLWRQRRSNSRLDVIKRFANAEALEGTLTAYA